MSSNTERQAQLQERLEAYLSEFAPSQQRTVVRGIEILNGLAANDLDTLVHYLTDVAADPSLVDPEQQTEERRLGLSREDYNAAITAIGFLVAPVTTEDSDDDLLITTIGNGIGLPPDHLGCLARIARAIRAIAPEIKSASLKNRVANSTLPSFEDIQMSVDIRLNFSDRSEIDVAVPVVICFLDTDAANERLWFQLSKMQLWKMKKAIDRAVDQLEKAEAYIAK